MTFPAFHALVEDADYLVEVQSGLWLMDDHRWALKVWETERKQSAYTLVHADFHWDSCYDFHDSPEAEKMLIGASAKEVADMVAAGELIRYDSFIAPAIKRGLVHTVHFYCLQDGPGDKGIYEEFMSACNAKQVMHKTPHELASASIEGPLIFDLCLDLFNKSEVWADGDLWNDEEILAFLRMVRHFVEAAELVTVSMSFNYSGTAADTRRLTALALPILCEFRRGD